MMITAMSLYRLAGAAGDNEAVHRDVRTLPSVSPGFPSDASSRKDYFSQWFIYFSFSIHFRSQLFQTFKYVRLPQHATKIKLTRSDRFTRGGGCKSSRGTEIRETEWKDNRGEWRSRRHGNAPPFTHHHVILRRSYSCDVNEW